MYRLIQSRPPLLHPRPNNLITTNAVLSQSLPPTKQRSQWSRAEWRLQYRRPSRVCARSRPQRRNRRPARHRRACSPARTSAPSARGSLCKFSTARVCVYNGSLCRCDVERSRTTSSSALSLLHAYHRYIHLNTCLCVCVFVFVFRF